MWYIYEEDRGGERYIGRTKREDKLEGKKILYFGIEDSVEANKIQISERRRVEREGRDKSSEFIRKVLERNPENRILYDYSGINFRGVGEKIEIGCIKHGKFEQRANNHLEGCGCPKCRKNYNLRKEFIRRVKMIHGNKYDYRLSFFIDYEKPIIIICKEHGQFLETPMRHLLGKGCKFCEVDNIKEILRKNGISFEEDYLGFNFRIKGKKIFIDYEWNELDERKRKVILENNYFYFNLRDYNIFNIIQTYLI